MPTLGEVAFVVGEQTAAQCLARLAAVPRRAQRDLQRLAEVWTRHPRSCFNWRFYAQAQPTATAVGIVLRYLAHQSDHISGAAYGAMERAARLARMDSEPTPEMPASIWEIEGTLDVVLHGLADERPLRRLWSSGLVASNPDARFAAHLRDRLVDPIYTVRWRAVAALARLGHRQGLLDVMATARPHRLPEGKWSSWDQPNGDYWEALAALDPSGAALDELGIPRPEDMDCWPQASRH